MPDNQGLISVVVSAYTTERYDDLIALLESLSAQSYLHFEVILVIEKSQALFKSVADYVNNRFTFKTVVIFNDGPQGLSSARNAGIEKSRGEIIAFIDDDAVAAPEWLAALHQTYVSMPAAAGVTGPIIPQWETPAMDWFPEDFLWIFACTGQGDGQVRTVRNGYGTNMSFRKAVFERCGAFNPYLGARGGGRRGKAEPVGEDTELAVRVKRLSGMSVIYAPDATVFHRAYEYRLRRPFLARRAYWEGYTKAAFQRRASENGDVADMGPEWTLLRRTFFRLIPAYFSDMLRFSTRARKRLNVTLTILTFVALGYTWGRIQPRHVQEKLLCPG